MSAPGTVPERTDGSKIIFPSPRHTIVHHARDTRTHGPVDRGRAGGKRHGPLCRFRTPGAQRLGSIVTAAPRGVDVRRGAHPSGLGFTIRTPGRHIEASWGIHAMTVV